MNQSQSSTPNATQSSMYQVTNYTSDELFSILSLDPATATESDVIDTTDEYISSFSARGMTAEMAFFQDIQTYLLQLMGKNEDDDENDEDENDEDDMDDDDDEDGNNNNGNTPGGVPNTYIGNQEQSAVWSQHAALPQEDATQSDKITQRTQKIDVYDNEALPMKREQLGVANQFNVPVVQDTLNPNLQNTITRFINLDSQYRQTAVGAVDSGSTDYTLDLSDTLTNVLNMRLYSFQIPFTWYAIDTHLGNTCIWIQIQPQDTDADIGSMPLTIPIQIPPGNYSQTSFITQFTQSVLDAGFVPPLDADSNGSNGSNGSDAPITINSNNAKATIRLYGWTKTISAGSVGSANSANSAGSDSGPITVVLTDTTTILFYDPSGAYACNVGCGSQTQVVDGTLGWLMGFRSDSVRVSPDGNTSDAVIDLAGPKYFILAIDDYNQNRINNGLVTITELAKTIKMPAYYNTSQPNICVEIAGATRPRAMAMVVPSAPRTITRAQIYTINEIVKTRQNTTRVRGRPPSISDTFAILAIKHNGLKTGDMYVEFAGALQDNKRIYFGPVDVGRMRVRLLDDRGNLVNLNGSEWCVTILSEQLYQY